MGRAISKSPGDLGVFAGFQQFNMVPEFFPIEHPLGRVVWTHDGGISIILFVRIIKRQPLAFIPQDQTGAIGRSGDTAAAVGAGDDAGMEMVGRHGFLCSYWRRSFRTQTVSLYKCALKILGLGPLCGLLKRTFLIFTFLLMDLSIYITGFLEGR